MRVLESTTLRAWALAVAALVVYSEAPAQGTEPEYAVKADQPRTGSHIRRDAVKGGALPINRTYEQLTPEERAIVRGWYESMPAADEPPFPAEGMKPIHEAIGKAQAKLRARGELSLIATVGPNGEVSSVNAVGSPNPEMARFAGQVLLLTKFKPAVCGGQPCRMDFPLRYTFHVD